MSEFFLGTVGRGKVGRTQYVDNKTHTRGQDKHIRPPKIGGRVASLVATVAHIKSLMDMSNQWSLSVVKNVSFIRRVPHLWGIYSL
jgi:hypothetical protein